MIFKSLMLFAGLVCGTYLAGEPLFDEPMPELHLKNGKVLYDAQIKGYGAQTAMVKHREGGITVKYEDLPMDFQREVFKRGYGENPDPAQLIVDPIIPEKENPQPTSYVEPSIPPQPPVHREPPEPSLNFGLPPPLESSTSWLSHKIAGQIFITVKNGSAVKLAGVKVSVYSKTDWEKQIRWIGNGIAKAKAQFNARGKYFDGLNKYTQSIAEYDKALKLIHLEWTAIAPARFSATTDADGYFMLSHKESTPFIVEASTVREIGDESELVRWAISSEEIIDTEKIFLSNDNLEH